MRIFIGKLVVFVFLISFFCLSSAQHATENITNGRIVLANSITPSDLPKATSQGDDSRYLARRDIFEIVFGTFLSIIGLSLIALSVLRWKANDLSLLSFAILCFLYGARTKAFLFLFNIPLGSWHYMHWLITYLIPIPAWLFTEQFLGKGWKSSIRRLLQAQIIFSIIAISASIYMGEPATAAIGNNIIVITGILIITANFFLTKLQLNRELKMLRAGFLIFALLALHANITPWLPKGYASIDLEWLGFIIFINCLGYAVAHRFFQNEKDLITIANDLETARRIQSFILPGESIRIEGLSLTARYVPVASVAGDFYDFVKVDEKRLGILIADVSGHGVPASLISSMVKIAFASNTAHAANPAQMLDGINKVLCGKLESDFVSAGYLFLDTENKTMIYAGAGHVPLLLWRPAEKKVYEFREKGTILGQFEDIEFKNIQFAIEPDDRIVLYTDAFKRIHHVTCTAYGGTICRCAHPSDIRLVREALRRSAG